MSKHKDGANHKTGHKKDKRKREAEGAHVAVPIQAAGVELHEKIKLPKRQSRGDHIEPDYPFRRIPAKH